MIFVIESIVQEENESKGENIRLGIKYRVAGTSKIYDRKCYGYKNDEEDMTIDDDKVKKLS